MAMMMITIMMMNTVLQFNRKSRKKKAQHIHTYTFVSYNAVILVERIYDHAISSREHQIHHLFFWMKLRSNIRRSPKVLEKWDPSFYYSLDDYVDPQRRPRIVLVLLFRTSPRSLGSSRSRFYSTSPDWYRLNVFLPTLYIAPPRHNAFWWQWELQREEHRYSLTFSTLFRNQGKKIIKQTVSISFGAGTTISLNLLKRLCSFINSFHYYGE